MRLRVIDFETTGLTPDEHAVCEIGWADVVPDNRDLVDTPTWRLDGHFRSLLTNPGRAIPPEISSVHHIIDEDVKDSPPWRDALSLLVVHQQVDVLVAHSAKFERQFMTDEISGGLPWICTYKCALRLWPGAPSHSNQALRYWRRPAGLDRGRANVAHRAGPDAYVTAFHLRDMLELAPVDRLIEWSSQPALQARCHIGKWRGTPWKEVDDGFLYWVSERDFDEDVLFTVHHEMDRRRDQRAQDLASADIGEEPF